MLSSEAPEAQSVPPAAEGVGTSASGAIAGSLIVLLVGALIMVAVARTGPESRDLPLLPPIADAGSGGGELAAFTSSRPPAALGPGVVAPAGEAPAYRLNAATSPEIVTALTVALGLTAGSDSRSTDSAFLVADNRSDRVLRVEKAAGHPWTLTRGDPDCLDRPDSVVSSDGRVSCPASGVGTSGSTQGGGSGASAGSTGSESQGASSEEARCPPVECQPGQACAQVCPDPTPVTRPFPFESDEPSFELPDPAAAENRTREVLNAMGLEVARTTLAAAPDGSAWQVLAEVSVGGIAAVGMETHLSIGEDTEVIAGRGMIPDVEPLGRYPLIGAPEALSRLQRTVAARPSGGPEPAIAPAPGNDAAGETVVTGIRLVLLLQAGNVEQRAGDYLVPAFLIDASDGAVFTVPAATDEHLAPAETGPGADSGPREPQSQFD